MRIGITPGSLVGLLAIVSSLHCSAAAPTEPDTGGAPAGGADSGSTGSTGGAGGSVAVGGAGSGGNGGSGGSGPALLWRCVDQPQFATGHTCTCSKDCPGNCGLTECPSLPCCSEYTTTLTATPTTMCMCIAADHLALTAKTCDDWATGNHCGLADPCVGTRVGSCPP